MLTQPSSLFNSAEFIPVKTVLLRHDLADGSAHYDWLIARDPQGEKPLICFRVRDRVNELRAGRSITAERIGDHRPLYLTYEGPVSGGRGVVSQVAAGRVAACEPLAAGPAHESWRLKVCWGDSIDAVPAQELRLIQRNSPLWTLFCDTISGSDRV